MTNPIPPKGTAESAARHIDASVEGRLCPCGHAYREHMKSGCAVCSCRKFAASPPEQQGTPDIERERPMLPQAIRTALDDYARDCEAYGQGKPTSLLTTRAILETRIMRAIRIAGNPPVWREWRGA